MQLHCPPFQGGQLVHISWLPSSVTLVSAFSIASHRPLSCSCIHAPIITSFLSFLSSLQLCAMLDHFGYPALLFSGWRQAGWYNLHLTEVWLHNICQCIIDGHEPLPMIGAMLADLPPREENIPESSSVTAPTNTVTSSSSPALAAQPTVAHKEPQNHTLHEQAVGSTVSIGTGCKPTRLDPPGSAAFSHGKQSRSPFRKSKDKKSKRCTLCTKTLPLVDPLTTQKHGSSTSAESDDDGN